MADNIVLPGDAVYFILVPIILTSIPGIWMFIKRQELTGSKSATTEMNITSIRTDLVEVKSDVKELRKDQLGFSNSLNDIRMLKERIEKIEERQDIQADALRQIDNIKWRLQTLEQRKNGAV